MCVGMHMGVLLYKICLYGYSEFMHIFMHYFYVLLCTSVYIYMQQISLDPVRAYHDDVGSMTPNACAKRASALMVCNHDGMCACVCMPANMPYQQMMLMLRNTANIVK